MSKGDPDGETVQNKTDQIITKPQFSVETLSEPGLRFVPLPDLRGVRSNEAVSSHCIYSLSFDWRGVRLSRYTGN